ncbi:phage tail domain-containing protein [Amycolatopsis dendrobii]|uniref:Phage tail family protein n=1 Tax=Amycolatopsis dendrobii TaxID=2760662 RepID=A0A7W3Z9T7_9PSEU|nr:phage tail domain-containing protein [Amycolatopsis dendrobii]MBB1153525.1 phage tail family protein [Amycolatopsis dendrobii]
MLGGQVWTLENIRFHHAYDVRDADGVQWILTKEEGFWGTPGTNATLSPRLNKHGQFRSPGWKKERTVTLTGRCYHPDYEVLRRAEANVLGLLSDPRAPGTLTCYSEIGVLSLDVFLDDAILCTPLDIVSEPGIEFSIQLVAPDPRKYSPETQVQTVGLPQDTGDGLDFSQVVSPEVDSGLYFGLGSSTTGLTFGTFNGVGFMTLSNPGTAPATPVFTLYGPLTSPVLTTSTGYSLRYNGTLGANDYVTIDPAVPAVVLNGQTSRRELLYPANFEAFNVPPAVAGQPGTLSVGLAHSGASTAGGYATAAYRAYWF